MLPVGLDFNYVMSSVGYVKKYVSMLLYNATVLLSSQAGGSKGYVEPHFPTLWLTKQTRPQACTCTKLLEVCLMRQVQNQSPQLHSFIKHHKLILPRHSTQTRRTSRITNFLSGAKCLVLQTGNVHRYTPLWEAQGRWKFVLLPHYGVYTGHLGASISGHQMAVLQQAD